MLIFIIHLTNYTRKLILVNFQLCNLENFNVNSSIIGRI